MAKPKLPATRQIECVQWVDSFGFAQGWISDDNANALALTEVLSVGVLVTDAEDRLVLASSWSNGDSSQYGGVLAIPKVAVLSRHKLA